MSGELPDYLIEAQEEADEAQVKWAELDRQTKAAKKQWEAKQEDVAKMIRDAASGQPRLPGFDGKDNDRGGGSDDDKPKPPPAPSGDSEVIDADFTIKQLDGPPGSIIKALHVPVVKSDPEAWRIVPISRLRDLGLAQGLVTKLEENGLKTIGDLSDWTNSGKQLDDLDGIGEAKAGEIMDCLDVFWAEWQHRDAVVPEPENAVLTGDPKPKKKSGRKAG